VSRGFGLDTGACDAMGLSNERRYLLNLIDNYQRTRLEKLVSPEKKKKEEMQRKKRGQAFKFSAVLVLYKQ
jgi:hypothetical protein